MKNIILNVLFVANIIFAESCDDSSIISLPWVSQPPKITPLPIPIFSKQPIISTTLSNKLTTRRLSSIPTPSQSLTFTFESEPTSKTTTTESTLEPEPTSKTTTIEQTLEPEPTTIIEPTLEPEPTSKTTTINVEPTPEIQNIIEYIFKPNDISDIITLHNVERQLNNLTNMIWNDNLKDSSQIWSNELAKMGCILEHKLFSSAQNLYAGYGWIEPDMSRAVQMWLDEKNILNKPNVTFNEIGHYLIIISNSLNEVGCASSINVNNNCFVVTCNYS